MYLFVPGNRPGNKLILVKNAAVFNAGVTSLSDFLSEMLYHATYPFATEISFTCKM